MPASSTIIGYNDVGDRAKNPLNLVLAQSFVIIVLKLVDIQRVIHESDLDPPMAGAHGASVGGNAPDSEIAWQDLPKIWANAKIRKLLHARTLGAKNVLFNTIPSEVCMDTALIHSCSQFSTSCKLLSNTSALKTAVVPGREFFSI